MFFIQLLLRFSRVKPINRTVTLIIHTLKGRSNTLTSISGGFVTAFPALKVSVKNGLFLGQMTWVKLVS
jgi:hypothetical protein